MKFLFEWWKIYPDLNQNIYLAQEAVFTMNGTLQKNSNLNSAHP